METVDEKMQFSVREEYRILLRGEAELMLPAEYPKICTFYRTMAKVCLNWAKKEWGEQIRREYLSLTEMRDRCRFALYRYRLLVRIVYEDSKHIAMVGKTYQNGAGAMTEGDVYRVSHVWDRAEESILPPEQILNRFGARIAGKSLPFHPDGIYPEGEEIVFFRNATQALSYVEKRIRRGDYAKRDAK